MQICVFRDTRDTWGYTDSSIPVIVMASRRIFLRFPDSSLVVVKHNFSYPPGN